MIPSWRLVLLPAFSFVAACVGEPLLGQESGTLVGTVVEDASAEPLPEALVSLSGLPWQARADSLGAFALNAIPTGALTARVELSGYATIVESIEVLPGEVVLFQFRLSRLEVAIQGLVVRARERERERSTGSLVSELRVSERSRTALDLLREKVPGVMVRTSLGAETGIRIRSSSSLHSNEPAIFIDGILVGEGGVAVHTLEQLPAERVLRIRVLHGPSSAASYADPARGAILVETR